MTNHDDLSLGVGMPTLFAKLTHPDCLTLPITRDSSDQGGTLGFIQGHSVRWGGARGLAAGGVITSATILLTLDSHPLVDYRSPGVLPRCMCPDLRQCIAVG